ncbi:DNA-binding transcriptional regulator, LysR family [Filomicrobium insigne]|jgi:DNA-binding transcriptional LysR family regulator|uniref:DNA-binding transcriptional regulator, LysR family n=1 Tax=Filomicrobium insigne TaxID=418854 RepID=A0A1H0JN31_9HYPH|nr:LysR family transcriptional regulator [Filomicrobium insigne]SDO45197.1 DNA-binding transcriptional regulator, LysR family [Filomicrobium insigne]
MDRFASMEAFAKVADTGSFTAAADALGISGQMVGKHIRLLEEHLGVRLLNRTTRQQSLTDAGKDFLERTRIVLAELEAAEALAADSRARPRGELRVNAPVTFGTHSLAPLVPAYMAANPEVTVRLTLNDRVVDLVDEGYDCVFRAGPLTDSTLIARGLRPMELIACASPTYLEARGTPTAPGDLTGHDCLGFAGSAIEERWEFNGRDDTVAVRVTSRFSTNSGQALKEAALAGLGIIFQASELTLEDVKAGRLIRVLPDWRATRPMHLLFAPDRRVTPKLRSFIEFAASRFG